MSLCRTGKKTLLPIIKRVVRPGSIIHSDEFQSYNDLAMMNFELKRVCHKYNFVCPKTGIHTQHVESYNNKIKLRIKEVKGVRGENRKSFLDEFMWFDQNKPNRFFNLIGLLKI